MIYRIQKIDKDGTLYYRDLTEEEFKKHIIESMIQAQDIEYIEETQIVLEKLKQLL